MTLREDRSPGPRARTRHSGLDELAKLSVDDVLAGAHEPPDDYRHLYYRWESEQWEAGAIDLTADARAWSSGLPSGLGAAIAAQLAPLWPVHRDAQDLLVAMADAAPTEEQQVFLTTQLADEARHAVFLDRYAVEVLGADPGDMAARLGGRALAPDWGEVLEVVPSTTGALRAAPGPRALGRALLLYVLFLDGTLFATSLSFLHDHLGAAGLLPGLRVASVAIARDIGRHVGFALRFVRDGLSDAALDPGALGADLSRVSSAGLDALGAAVGGGGHPLPYTPDDLRAAAAQVLDRYLRTLDLELVAPRL